ncbi:hypothetical protein P7K49_017628 [Saguinus oedipus]|uniref:Uncharacterized protein n=1 Tax=Saguinus oedipus TaxID=9490 RepID=A0ABQ9V315_SAGOE|nr:hypothetical protein P7K49_017628 [Saguinus oedipus]
MTLPGGPTGMARPGGARPCSPGLERAPRRSVGELRLLFEARCAAVAAAAAAGEPRARRAKRRGEQVPNGLPRAPPAPVIPQLTVTAEEPDVPPTSPGPPERERDCLPAGGSSHLQQPRRLSTSSVSSTGSSSLLEDSEDDLLSDSESRSRGNVQLEASEDVGQREELALDPRYASVSEAEGEARGAPGFGRLGPAQKARSSRRGGDSCGRAPAPPHTRMGRRGEAVATCRGSQAQRAVGFVSDTRGKASQSSNNPRSQVRSAPTPSRACRFPFSSPGGQGSPGPRIVSGVTLA